MRRMTEYSLIHFGEMFHCGPRIDIKKNQFCDKLDTEEPPSEEIRRRQKIAQSINPKWKQNWMRNTIHLKYNRANLVGLTRCFIILQKNRIEWIRLRPTNA